MNPKIVIPMLLLTALTISCTTKEKNAAVYSVNSHTTSKSELFKEIPESEFRNGDFKSRQSQIEKLITNNIIILESQKHGIIDSASFHSRLDYRIQIVTVDKMIEDEVWQPILTDSSLQILYDRMKNEVGVSHIIIPFKGSKRSSTQRTKQEAFTLIKKIRTDIIDKNITFEKAARKYSEDPSALEFGKLGYYNWGSLFEPIQSTAFSLNLRELSKPIESAFGFHLVYVYGKRMNRLPPFEDYKGELQKFIRSRRGPEFENSLKHYESRLVTNYKLIIIQENIFSLFNYLKEKLKSNKFQMEDLLKVDFVPPLFNMSGCEYHLTWFKDKIKRGSILSKSPITSGRDLLKAIEHFIFRHLSMEASKEKHSIWQVRNRQKARNQIIEELKRKIIDKIKSETSNTNLNEYLMMDSLLLQYEIEINESFIKTYK